MSRLASSSVARSVTIGGIEFVNSHDAARPNKLALNQGKKWRADEPLRAGMGRSGSHVEHPGFKSIGVPHRQIQESLMKFTIPQPLQNEHEALHERLRQATEVEGEVGEAARTVARQRLGAPAAGQA